MFKNIIILLVGMFLTFSSLSLAQEAGNQDEYQNNGAVEMLTNTDDESVMEDVNEDLMNEESLNDETQSEVDSSSETSSGNIVQ